MSSHESAPAPLHIPRFWLVLWLLVSAGLVLYNLILTYNANFEPTRTFWMPGTLAAVLFALGYNAFERGYLNSTLQGGLIGLLWAAVAWLQIQAVSDNPQAQFESAALLTAALLLVGGVLLLVLLQRALKPRADFSDSVELLPTGQIDQQAAAWFQSQPAGPAAASPAARPWSVGLALLLPGLAITGLTLLLPALAQNNPPQNLPHLPSPALFLWTALGAAAALLGAWCCLPLRQPAPPVRWFTRLAHWLDVRPAQAVCLLLSPVFGVLTYWAAGSDMLMRVGWMAVLSWAVSAALLVAGAWNAPREPEPILWNALAWAGGLMLLAFALRGIATAAIPFVLTGDEASMGLNALEFLQGRRTNLFNTGWFSFPALFYFLKSFSILLLGQTTPALRIPAALVGSATVGCTYLLGRQLFGHRTGLLAGILLAGMHFHIHFSRLGLNNIWDGLFFTTCLLMVWQAWQTRRRSAYLLTGLLAGLAQYFYTSTRLLGVVLPIWILYMLVKERPTLRRLLPNILLAAFAALVIFLPLGLYYLDHPAEFMAPMQRVSIWGDWMRTASLTSLHSPDEVLRRQMTAALLGYAFLPSQHWYVPEVPILRLAPAFFFLLGLALLVFRERKGQGMLLMLWLVGFGIAGGLSTDVPAAQRYVAAAPACMLAAAYGLKRVNSLLSQLWPRRRQLLAALTLMAALGMAADDARFYLVDFQAHGLFGGINGYIAQELANELQHRSSEWQVVFVGFPNMGYDSINSVPYLAPHIQGITVLGPWGSDMTAQPTSSHLLFVILREREPDLAMIRKQYPGGKLYRKDWVDGQLLYDLYEYSKP